MRIEKLLILILLQCVAYSGFSLNVTIIESQSFNSGHVMDTRWSAVVTSMGHTATILPQNTLDNNTFFATTDILIISSGVINLPANRVAVILQFLQSGKPVYLQCEYLDTYGTNQAYSSIIASLGGTFTWDNPFSGNLAPVTVLGTYATTNNMVSSLTYFWYSYSGSGDCNLVPVLEQAGAYHGFQYVPSNPLFGTITATTDQDFINQSTSINFMENIITHLITPPNPAGGGGVYLGVDTMICPGDTVVLNATTPNATYIWQDNSTASTFNVTQGGTYFVEVTGNGCIYTDSIVFIDSCALANPVTTTIDTMVCFGDFFFYPGSGTNLPPNTVDTFLYQTSTLADSFVIVTVTGSDTFNITIDTSACLGSTLFFGGQTVQILQTNSTFTFNLQTINGCDSTLTVNVNGLDSLRYTLDTSICLNSTLNFGGQVLLPNTSTNFIFPALNACDTILTVNVTGLDVFSSAISTTICHGDSLAYAGQFLGVNTTTVFNLQTVNGCDSIISLTVLGLDTFYTMIDTTVVNGGTILFSGQTLLPNTTTTFNLQTTAGCDSIIIVNVTEILVSVFEGIPDIFSPNGDGVNDLFFPIGLNQNDVIRFRVFNRWSQEIYIGDNLENAGWDGRFQGVDQPSEVYIYLLEYDLGAGEGPKIIKGNFTLIR